MFTGLVEEIGKVREMSRISAYAISLRVRASLIMDDVKIGDSIAVNGVCLTVSELDQNHFSADVMPETVKATSLTSLRIGSPVNLERAMPANGRFGGHFVSGHVDAAGTILSRTPRENAIYYEIKVPGGSSPFMMQKGSIAVEGTSLTIFDATPETFTVSLIPLTAKGTILGKKKPGDLVNIEFDLLAKQLCHLASLQEEKSGQMSSLLASNGYM